jgi:hypothetical protein
MARDGRRLQEHFSFGKRQQLGGFHRAKKEFSGVGAAVSYLNKKETTMKLTTIALAIAFALPSTFALARGGMSIGSHVTRPFGGAAVGAAGRIANRPRNVSGNTVAPIAHDPSGSTITQPAINRGG